MIDKHTYKCEDKPEQIKMVSEGFDNIPNDLVPKSAKAVIPAEVAQAAADAIRAKEYKSLFENPKTARKMWRNVGLAVAMRPASKPVEVLNKDGVETFESAVQSYTYRSLKNDVDHLMFGDAGPTEMEMIMACQAVMARTSPAAFTAFLDRTGGKPVDETKLDAQVTNPYESLTDEELELIAELRRKKAEQNNV